MYFGRFLSQNTLPTFTNFFRGQSTLALLKGTTVAAEIQTHNFRATSMLTKLLT